MFVRTLLNPECHLEILKTPRVVEILKSPSGPTPVPEEQIENVRLLEKHVGACFFGTDFEAGDSVFVKEGPLTGLRGVIDRLDRKKNRPCQNLSAVPANTQWLISWIEHLKLFVVQTHVYQALRLGAYPEYIPAFFSTILHNIFRMNVDANYS